MRIAAKWNPRLEHRDRDGNVRIIAADVRYERFVERSFDKIRQASRGMPAVMIRQLEAITKIMSYASSESQRAALMEQADMIITASDESVPAGPDRADVRARYEAATAMAASVLD